MSKRTQGDPETAKYKEKCNSIIAISPRIRYAGIINKFGRTLAGSLRKGVTPLLNPDEARNEYFIEATRSQLRKSLEKSIGKTEYSHTENERVRIVAIPTGDHFYYITIDKDTSASDLASIIEKTRKMI
ncbi:MAG TPA: DUF6659 family protein [Nitrososphaera sp.]|jgi:hypothetical protein|nr:DUF6659 family protein [Nitrososphaera sp.]